MLLKLPMIAFVSVALLGATTAEPVTLGAADIHLALQKSVPAADAEVEMVHEVALWFTEPPQENSVSIRVIDASGEAARVGGVERDSDDATAFTASLEGHLAPGGYTVAWRAMGSDGHVVRGEYSFSVRAH